MIYGIESDTSKLPFTGTTVSNTILLTRWYVTVNGKQLDSLQADTRRQVYTGLLSALGRGEKEILAAGGQRGLKC
jgi:hypothetical protein